MIETVNTTSIDTRREVEGKEQLQLLTDAFCDNQKFLERNAAFFGLNRDYFQAKPSVIVGPFVNASPLPTLFIGDPMNVRISQSTASVLANLLRKNGYKAEPNLTIPLAISQFPIKGGEALNSLIVPKNATTNKRIQLVKNVELGTAYQSVEITLEDLQVVRKELQDSFPKFMDRFPYLRRRASDETMQGRKIMEEIIGDLEFAFMTVLNRSGSVKNSTINYLEFITEYNNIVARRFDPNYPLSAAPVDTTVYDDFFRNGISDISQFARRMEEIGTFSEDPAFVKIIGSDGKTRTLNLVTIQEKDLLLQFADNQSLIRYSDLLSQPNKIAPCKDLSYILCFGSFVPVMYGDDNIGGSYQPYVNADNRVRQLGLTPVFYNIQPPLLEGYAAAETVFDFYSRLLGKEKIL